MPLIAKRYAEALVEMASEKSALGNYQYELGIVVDTINQCPDLKFFLMNPEIKADAKKEVVKKIFGAEIRDPIINFLMITLDKERVEFLTDIFKEFISLADKRRNILNITILSSIPLEDSQIKLIEEKYRKEYNAYAVKSEFKLDKDLIGGVKVVIGDKVVDSSVKGKLESLKEFLVN